MDRNCYKVIGVIASTSNEELDILGMKRHLHRAFSKVFFVVRQGCFISNDYRALFYEQSRRASFYRQNVPPR